jgi:flagellar motor switch protein FliN/FliY
MSMSMTDSRTDILAGLVGPAVAAVADMAGVSLTPSAPVVVDAIDAATTASSVTVRVPLTASGTDTGVAVVVPAAGHKLDPMRVAATMVGAIAGELTRITGNPHAAGTPEEITGTPAVDPGDTILRFEVGNGAGPALPIHWMVEATLVLALAGGGPVTSPQAAQPSVAPAAFPELANNVGTGAARDLTLLSDVPMDVTVELGRAVLQVRQLLGLREGSVVELDRDAGAAVDVLVNGTLIARGDVVVIDDDLGVRITEIVQR